MVGGNTAVFHARKNHREKHWVENRLAAKSNHWWIGFFAKLTANRFKKCISFTKKTSQFIAFQSSSDLSCTITQNNVLSCLEFSIKNSDAQNQQGGQLVQQTSYSAAYSGNSAGTSQSGLQTNQQQQYYDPSQQQQYQYGQTSQGNEELEKYYFFLKKYYEIILSIKYQTH